MNCLRIILLSAALGAVGCGAGDDLADEADSFCSSAGNICANVYVAPEAGHTFRQFSLVGYEQEVPAGPPDARFAEFFDPVIEDGVIQVESELDPYRGDYYVWGILYNTEDEDALATPGLDYIGQTASPIAFDGSAIRVDRIDLELVP